MPTYEYLCKTCGHRFETWQKMTDDPLTTCPTCGAAIRRVLFPAGVVFKGSGFYKTDHRDSGSHESSTKDDAKSGGDGGKTEATPAASENSGSKDSSKPAETSSSTSSGDSKAPTSTSAA